MQKKKRVDTCMLNLILCSAECSHMQSTLVLIATTRTDVHKTIVFNEQINKGPARVLNILVHLVTDLGKTKT